MNKKEIELAKVNALIYGIGFLRITRDESGGLEYEAVDPKTVDIENGLVLSKEDGRCDNSEILNRDYSAYF